MGFDPRLTPARADLAAERLRGQVTATRFVSPQIHQVTAPILDLVGRPDAAALDTQLLLGELFEVYELDAATGLAWGQNLIDGYVGYVSIKGLSDQPDKPTHRVVTLGSQRYAAPRLKSKPLDALPFLAQVAVIEKDGDFWGLSDGSWCPGPTLAPLDQPMEGDFVAVAERMEGVPYVWGGRSHLGLDCSALVQLALAATGLSAPRDSDMQEDLGTPVIADDLQRGDLVFWPGHVGIMRNAHELLHANAHHMAVVSEPLAQAVERIANTETGAVTAMRRLAGA